MATELVPTFGWDLVFAIRVPRVNEYITECAGPARELEEAVDDIGVTASISGWRIVPGGSNYLLWLSLDIANGKITIPGKSTIAFAGQAIVAVELHVVHSNVEGILCAALQVSRSSDSANRGAHAAHPFYVRDLHLDGVGNPVVKGVVQLAVQQWLNKNPDAIEHVFATVDLVEGGRQHSLAWPHPTSINYAYCDAPEIEDCLIAVLAMVEGRSSSGLDQAVSPHAVPPGCTSAVVISPRLLLDGIVRDAAVQAFKGLRREDFVMSPVAPEMRLAHELDLEPVIQKGRPLRHILNSFRVAFDGSELLCRTENTIIVNEGVSVTTITQVAHSLAGERQEDGSLGLHFVYLRPPEIDHRPYIDPAIKEHNEHVAEAILIGGAVLSLFGGPLFFIVATVETAIMAGVTEYSAEILLSMAEPAPSIDLVASLVTVPCVWSGQHTFKAISAELAGSLRLGGGLS